MKTKDQIAEEAAREIWRAARKGGASSSPEPYIVNYKNIILAALNEFEAQQQGVTDSKVDSLIGGIRKQFGLSHEHVFLTDGGECQVCRKPHWQILSESQKDSSLSHDATGEKMYSSERKQK